MTKIHGEGLTPDSEVTYVKDGQISWKSQNDSLPVVPKNTE